MVLAAGLLAGSGMAAATSPEGRTSPGQAAGIAELGWLAGSWAGAAGGIDMEEVWLPPKGGAMLGLHRDVAAGRMVSFEFLRIDAEAGGLVYLASPKGRPATPFRLVESGKGRAVFSNPRHDFPQRILYWLEGDVLHARIEGDRGGKPAAEEWAWRRTGP